MHIDTGTETPVATTSRRGAPEVGETVQAAAPADLLCYFDGATEKAL